MKIFVTGSGGFIGSHLCEALRDAGHDVTGMAHYRSQDSHAWLDEVDGVRKVRGDIRDTVWTWNEIVAEGFEAIYHLAALGSVPYSYDAPQSFIDTNVTGTKNILDIAVRTGAKLIHMSTSEVYGTAQYEPQDEKHPINPQSPYAASKVAADALVTSFAATYDMDCTIMRAFNTYGPRQSERALVATIIRQYLDPQCEDVRLGDLNTTRDLLYVKDTCSALVAALSVKGLGPWNIGTGSSASVSDLAFALSDLGKKPVVGSRELMRPEGSEVRRLVCDSTAFRKVSGWRPKWVLGDGLHATAEWWRTRPFRKGVCDVV